MSRTVFDNELQQLQDELLVLGIMVERAILKAVEALKQRNLEEARRIIEGDKELNKKRFAIESASIIIIATKQPMAGDLRTIAAVLEIAGELERIGDYAKGIAKITLNMGSEPHIKPLIDIPRMADKVCDMLNRALRAFVERDLQAARAIPTDDDEVDALYNQVFRELMTYVIADPRVIERVNYLIWVAHNLERSADRVVNICERIIFTVTGELGEIEDAKGKEM
jgi:phosphate transport system protein